MKATGTRKMFVANAEEAPEGVIIKEDDVILAIVGSKDAIWKAKLFVEFQIAHIHEIQSLRLTKFEIHEKKMIAYSKNRSKITSNSFTTQTNNTKQDSEIRQFTSQTDDNDDESVNLESQDQSKESDSNSSDGWTNLDFTSLDIPASTEELSDELIISDDDGVRSRLSHQGGSRSDHEIHKY